MKHHKLFLFFLLILLPLHKLFAQIAIPIGYFSSPLDIELTITGSFSEVRSNHFHSGIDFSVQQKVGLPVFAVADGVVSRIKVSPVGFGNALYIDHPNGFTSVYAHLYGYNDTITSYLRTNQYKVRSFEVDLFPKNKKEYINIKKGQIIGYAGNSGSSGGAHLHFELRNTTTENIINPLLFGFIIPDKYPPIIDFLKIYPEDDNSFIGKSNDPIRLNLKKSGNREYRLSTKDTISLWGNFSFGLQAFDFNQSPNNRNGFYELRMFIDSTEFFVMVCDSFAFAESRYVNASIDYAENYKTGNRIIKSKKLAGNKLSFSNTETNRGVLALNDTKTHEINVLVGDVSGNTTKLKFWVKPQKPIGVVQVPFVTDSDSNIFFKYNKINKFETKDLKVELPLGSIYEDLVFQYRKASGSNSFFSEVHYLHDVETPIHNRIRISIKPTNLPQRLQSKAMLVRVDKNGKRSPAGGSYENGFVSSTTNIFDGFAITVDTIPPSIKPWAGNDKSKTYLKFTVSDNFSGIKTYKGTINDKWVLVEWDPKNKLMTYKFDNMVETGTNTFILHLEDEKGNNSSYTSTIIK
ncbi:MAG: M23 family metallopeptidase [Bacteroidales bacterium]